MQARYRLRYAANLANLSTPLGLAVAIGMHCPVHRGPDGLLLAVNYRPALPRAGAFTLGNVVLLRCGFSEAMGRPLLLRHEARHSSQCAWCFGLPFLPLYALAALWSWWRTGDPASRNVFERHAGLRAGGYVERPIRAHPVSSVLASRPGLAGRLRRASRPGRAGRPAKP